MRGSRIGAVRAYSRHGQSMQAALRHRAIEPAWINPDRYHLNMSVQPNNISETPCGPMLKHGRRVAVDCLTVSERHFIASSPTSAKARVDKVQLSRYEMPEPLRETVCCLRLSRGFIVY